MKKAFLTLIFISSLSGLIYAQSNIRQVDFQNFTYEPYCAGDDSTGVYAKIKVTNGTIKNIKVVGEMDEPIDDKLPNYFDVDKPIYGDLNGDGKEEAVITSVCNTGGTGQFSEGYIYTLKNGKPVLLTRFEGGDRGFGGIVDVKFEKGLLVIEQNDSVGGANCCANFTLTRRYNLSGKKLAAVGKAMRKDLHPKERLAFTAQTSEVEKTVKLSGGGTQRFVLKARAGQTLFVTALDSKNIGFGIISDNAEGSGENENSLTAKISAAGDVIFEVGNNTDQPLTARIKISVK